MKTNKKERDEFHKVRINAMLNRIKEKTGKPISKIPELNKEFKEWESGYLETASFALTVIEYFNEME